MVDGDGGGGEGGEEGGAVEGEDVGVGDEDELGGGGEVGEAGGELEEKVRADERGVGLEGDGGVAGVTERGEGGRGAG